MPKMTMEELKPLWLKALRSDEYIQITGDYSDEEFGRNTKCFCTLGLGAHVVDPSNMWVGMDTIEDLILDRGLFSAIAARNDGRGEFQKHTFHEMANWLETVL